MGEPRPRSGLRRRRQRSGAQEPWDPRRGSASADRRGRSRVPLQVVEESARGASNDEDVARRLLSCAALLALVALAVPAAARAASVDNGGRADRSVQQLQRGAATACRTPLRSVSDDAPQQCAAVDGRAISEARIKVYEQSWTHRALSLQRGLDESVPLAQEQMPHTHNSFNASSYTLGSTSYYPTLTNQDPNQVYSITDQLRMDVRAIEIDLHWWPSPFGSPDTGGKWVTMCHGNSDTAPLNGVHV